MPEYGIGATALGMCGGLSIGMRLALMREGLLVPLYTVNWIIICLFAVAGVLMVVWRERLGIVRVILHHYFSFTCASRRGRSIHVLFLKSN